MAGNGSRGGATRSRSGGGAPASVSMPMSADGLNNVRRLAPGKSGQPFGLRANAIRTYQPRTPDGKAAKLGRVVNRRIIQPIKDLRRNVAPVLKEAQALQLSMARRQARAFADRGRDGAKGSIARISIRGSGGSLNRAAREVIQRRAQRAADAAARGSKPAERARVIYGNQLASTGPGKPSRAAKNNFRPGPSNTNYTRGTKKRRRRKP